MSSGDQTTILPSPASDGPLDEPKSPMPEQHQDSPGLESRLQPKPRYEAPQYKAAGKLEGKRALVTGGDSGIGRAVAALYAREGARLVVTCLPEEASDAEETRRAVEAAGSSCKVITGDLRDPQFCQQLIDDTVRELGGIDILVSNAAHQARK